MHTRPLLQLVGTVSALALASCGGCGSPVDQPNSTVPGQCQTTAPGVEPQRTDILFVIDNSGSMAEEQEGIARELPAFVSELKKGAGVEQDFQIGVITTSVYQNAQVGMLREFKDFSVQQGAMPPQAGRLQAVPDA